SEHHEGTRRLLLALPRLTSEMELSDAGTVSRRHFLRGTVPVLIGGLAMTLPLLTRAVLPADLGALVRDRESAERIGRHYLATLPVDTNSSQLLMMSPALGSALQTVQHDPAVAAQLLRRGIADDFRRADTVLVNGWVLAATEVRLCAMIALA